MISAAFRIFILSFLLLSFHGFAQSSMVSGKAKSYANQFLRVYVYDDLLTLREQQIAKVAIDSAGNFKVFLPLKYTAFVILKTETSHSSLYVDPAKNYLVSIPKLDAQSVATIGVEAYAPLKINSADSMELNVLIAKFENYLSDFYQRNLALIARKGIKKEAEKFKQAMRIRFASSNNPYFKSYVRFKLGTLEAAGGYNERYLFRNYFSGMVEYKSLEYMQFFDQTFTKHLEQLAGTSKGALIEQAISQKRNYSLAMSEILRADSLFKNDTLRELLLLKGLNEFYYLPKINKRNVLSLLAFVEKNGKHVENKKIARNIISLLTKMEVGSAAPTFALPDMSNKVVKLSDYKGRLVYLDFWATWCLPCLQEMKLKQMLKDKYADDIVFVSISIDKKFATMKNYLEKNKQYNSIFLFGGNDESIKENYNVKAIPAYVLIDRDGDILKAPALKPSENIEQLFKELLKKKN